MILASGADAVDIDGTRWGPVIGVGFFVVLPIVLVLTYNGIQATFFATDPPPEPEVVYVPESEREPPPSISQADCDNPDMWRSHSGNAELERMLQETRDEVCN